eukprot:CAMPEP_0119331142 /NCGR_PEP_ID=MMETSP1333-20130426/79894_1 /TAXON_ID=418940 /ORGANISM="Scyphosphaera apsteinii, Strain RCC1455" /LENGTH=36 /DNA_ID= /DNA_START= /DNA_END= /DNA_ORIENTATION=
MIGWGRHVIVFNDSINHVNGAVNGTGPSYRVGPTEQ